MPKIVHFKASIPDEIDVTDQDIIDGLHAYFRTVIPSKWTDEPEWYAEAARKAANLVPLNPSERSGIFEMFESCKVSGLPAWAKKTPDVFFREWGEWLGQSELIISRKSAYKYAAMVNWERRNIFDLTVGWDADSIRRAELGTHYLKLQFDAFKGMPAPFTKEIRGEVNYLVSEAAKPLIEFGIKQRKSSNSVIEYLTPIIGEPESVNVGILLNMIL